MTVVFILIVRSKPALCNDVFYSCNCSKKIMETPISEPIVNLSLTADE